MGGRGGGFTWSLPSKVRWMVTHLLGWAPLVVMAAMSESSSSFFSFSFLTRLSMALLAKLSFSPPCRWHIRLCTMLRQASLLLGAPRDMALLPCKARHGTALPVTPLQGTLRPPSPRLQGCSRDAGLSSASCTERLLVHRVRKRPEGDVEPVWHRRRDGHLGRQNGEDVGQSHASPRSSPAAWLPRSVPRTGREDERGDGDETRDVRGVPSLTAAQPKGGRRVAPGDGGGLLMGAFTPGCRPRWLLLSPVSSSWPRLNRARAAGAAL